MRFVAANDGSPTRARTWDLRINSPSLYQLSYQGIVFDDQSWTFASAVPSEAAYSIGRQWLWSISSVL